MVTALSAKVQRIFKTSELIADMAAAIYTFLLLLSRKGVL